MPDTFYLGLYGPEGELEELEGNGYHRVKLGEFQIQDSLHGERTATHIGDVAFPRATGNWGTVTGFGLFDSQGRVLYRGSLDRVIQVHADDTVMLSSGNLTVQWEGINPQPFGLQLRDEPLFRPAPNRKTLWERLEDDDP